MKNRIYPGLDHLCSSHLGAGYEYIVCADLLFRGFEVFKNCGPSGKADLVARGTRYKKYDSDGLPVPNWGRFMTIQVKGGVQTEYNWDSYDIFANVPDGSVNYHYLPSVFENSEHAFLPNSILDSKQILSVPRWQRPDNWSY